MRDSSRSGRAATSGSIACDDRPVRRAALVLPAGATQRVPAARLRILESGVDQPRLPHPGVTEDQQRAAAAARRTRRAPSAREPAPGRGRPSADSTASARAPDPHGRTRGTAPSSPRTAPDRAWPEPHAGAGTAATAAARSPTAARSRISARVISSSAGSMRSSSAQRPWRLSAAVRSSASRSRCSTVHSS